MINLYDVVWHVYEIYGGGGEMYAKNGTRLNHLLIFFRVFLCFRNIKSYVIHRTSIGKGIFFSYENVEFFPFHIVYTDYWVYQKVVIRFRKFIFFIKTKHRNYSYKYTSPKMTVVRYAVGTLTNTIFCEVLKFIPKPCSWCIVSCVTSFTANRDPNIELVLFNFT